MRKRSIHAPFSESVQSIFSTGLTSSPCEWYTSFIVRNFSGVLRALPQIFHLQSYCNILFCTYGLFYFAHVEHYSTCLDGIYVLIDNNYTRLTIFHGFHVHLNETIQIDELIKVPKQSIQYRTCDRNGKGRP